MLHDDMSSTELDDSDEEDLETILLHGMFPERTAIDNPRVHLEDLSDFQCEEMFRWVES